MGNGYRGFNPVFKRFTGMDSLSPFGQGGVNGFIYCEGDSINNTDKSGHGPLFDLIAALATVAERNARRTEEITPELRLAANNLAPSSANVVIKDGMATVEINGVTSIDSASATDFTDDFISRYLEEEHQFISKGERDRFNRRVGYYANNKKKLFSYTSAFETKEGRLDNFTVYIRGYDRKNRIISEISERNVNTSLIAEFESDLANRYPSQPRRRRNAFVLFEDGTFAGDISREEANFFGQNLGLPEAHIDDEDVLPL